MSNIVEITEGAEEYLGNLLKDSEEKDTNIRIFVSDPGSNRAETCIVYLNQANKIQLIFLKPIHHLTFF